MVVQFIVFLTLSTLICRGTDISKYFSESLGIRDNESRLYVSMDAFLSQLDSDVISSRDIHQKMLTHYISPSHVTRKIPGEIS